MNVNDKLEAVIEIAGSQNKASVLIGISQRQIGRYLRGEVAISSAIEDDLDRILDGRADLSVLADYSQAAYRGKAEAPKVEAPVKADIETLLNDVLEKTLPEPTIVEEKPEVLKAETASPRNVALLRAYTSSGFALLAETIGMVVSNNVAQVLTDDKCIVVIPTDRTAYAVENVIETSANVVFYRANKTVFTGDEGFSAYVLLDNGSRYLVEDARPILAQVIKGDFDNLQRNGEEVAFVVLSPDFTKEGLI